MRPNRHSVVLDIIGILPKAPQYYHPMYKTQIITNLRYRNTVGVTVGICGREVLWHLLESQQNLYVLLVDFFPLFWGSRGSYKFYSTSDFYIS